MKRLLVILAAAVMVMGIAISCGNKKENKSENKQENKAVELTEKAINAAKAGDVGVFTEAMFAINDLQENLSAEESEMIDKLMEEKFSDADQEVLEAFMNDHMFEIIQYAQDHGLAPAY